MITTAAPARESAPVLSPTGRADLARQAFDTGITRPLPWRREQLLALDRMLSENGSEIELALAADLGKHPLETLTSEINSVRTEIKDTIENLEEWTKPRTVPVPAGVQPAEATIHRQPLGSVLIISPWN